MLKKNNNFFWRFEKDFDIKKGLKKARKVMIIYQTCMNVVMNRVIDRVIDNSLSQQLHEAFFHGLFPFF
jgi:hypothetical protein